MARPANTMSFMDATKSGIGKSFTFSGRSSRSEYWWWMLAGILFQIICTIIAVLGNVGVAAIFPILLVLPTTTMIVRRLHDFEKSGWWLLIVLIPLIGILYLIYLFIQEGDMNENIYGRVPTNILE
ncbi:DUF805 domain-containing protein [Euryarchaeota archaeon]|jgi:uncharacterized membrane protein YhaH (DUF805 family)|nr:DUF805 domain-containing protein [Euryarchaeota archaeon]MDC0851859.1 DUF805 domain-containing protein [Euryarchaeota archaeon]MDC1029296.1 DUF805 domain-containing protein [Euryarchaeota archaeon]MDC3281842.1 DUF805 domain-containing protein [Euryarchaeota archaeon]|tara:strand:- start:23 stop:400 length:378 start_codon:yes stop_codon:yes gene_type:complete